MFQRVTRRSHRLAMRSTTPVVASRIPLTVGALLADGDRRNTARYEELVIAFGKTREAEEPQNAFYQQGEMANEAARVCIDVGELDVAERYYLLGSELGLREPEPRTHPKSLWDFRLAHARARLAARRNKADDARRHVADARRAFHEKACTLATSHIPPAAFTRPYARKTLAR